MPVALLAFAALGLAADRSDVQWEELDACFEGYVVAGLASLAGQLALLWALVAMHRSRPGGDGNASLILAGVVLTISVVILAAPILGFFAFIGAAIGLPLLALVAAPCALAALIGLVTADRARAPSGWIVGCTGTAGWLMALLGMPVAGGIVVLSLATL